MEMELTNHHHHYDDEDISLFHDCDSKFDGVPHQCITSASCVYSNLAFVPAIVLAHYNSKPTHATIYLILVVCSLLYHTRPHSLSMGFDRFCAFMAMGLHLLQVVSATYISLVLDLDVGTAATTSTTPASQQDLIEFYLASNQHELGPLVVGSLSPIHKSSGVTPLLAVASLQAFASLYFFFSALRHNYRHYVFYHSCWHCSCAVACVLFAWA